MSNLKMTDSLSISAWIYPAGQGSSTTEGGIIVNREGEYGVARFADGTIRWALANSKPGWVWINTGYVAPLNQWTHVVVAYDKGTTKTYANGRLVHTDTGSGAIGDVDAARNDFRIGGRQSISQHFQGRIDEVRIFSRPLGAREVAVLATPPARRVAHWKFDEGSGSTVSDATGKGSTGTLQGGPTWSTGKVGDGALAFDSVDDHVQVAAASARDVTNNFTVAFWANPQASHEIDEESATSQTGNVGQRYAIDPNEYSSSAHAGAGVSVGTNGISVYEHSVGYMPPLLVHEAPISGWTHIAVVYRDQRPGLYINGTLVKTGLRSPKSFVHMNPRTLGGMAFGYFRGQLDDVCIFDHVLSAREIAKLAGTPVTTEEGYRHTAYQTLLNRLGTSYEELRLSRQADEATRKGLAERLGIDFDEARAYRLDSLMLQPQQVTEATLETLFGLADTTSDPLVARSVPKLLAWRLEHLRTLWKGQDQPTNQTADSSPPIVDPDLVRQEDLVASTPDKPNPAFVLWQERSNWIGERLSQLAAISGTTAQDRFEKLIGATKLRPADTTQNSMADLLALDAQRKQGNNIEPELQKRRLSIGAFSYVIRMYNLAVAAGETDSLLDSEWSDVYSILVQVEKLHKYTDWRNVEANLTLSTDYFKLPAQGTAIAPSSSPGLPAWRATERDRRAWLNKVRARADQELAVVQGLQAALDSTEEATLPLLRDALIAAVSAPVANGDRSGEDVFNWLTDWLQIDIQSTGRRKTTRINQAIETIQGILFALRTNRFKDIATELDIISVYPRPDWKLAVSASDFDQEWAWMGSFATWRAAMLVFLYPENLLLPSLRGKLTDEFRIEQRSGSFETLVDNLRAQQLLTPDAARWEANDYLTRLRTLPVSSVLPDELKEPFRITEQLSEADLRARATQIRNAFAAYSPLPNDSADTLKAKKSKLFYIREAFYFVPIQIALQLQKSRQYTAALDWFQTVYAYNLPVTDERKIYYGLLLESSIKSSYERVLTKWLLGNDLNPHVIAANRANAYTRFTLQSLVRCFLDFADSEFTNETDESMSRARTLYLSALELLDLDEVQPPRDAGFAPNPIIEAMRRHVELNLFKLRDNRNIVGMQRQVEAPPPPRMINSLPTVGGRGQLTLPGVRPIRPTPYRYSTLVERAKQLVALAQQIEAAYLSSLVSLGESGYTELKARQDLSLATAGVDLQNLRVTEANDGVDLPDFSKRDHSFKLITTTN